MIRMRTLISIFAVVFLMACEGSERNAPIATADDIEAAAYVSTLPSSITLMTMVRANGEFGEHSGILINASQQVLYDPAGTFRHSTSPNARDVNYAMHPGMIAYYQSYHARRGYYVVVQEVAVTPEVADFIFQRAIAQGTTAKLYCAISISSVLNDIPMFAHIPTTFYPGKVMKRFAEIPGVVTTYVYEDDIG